MTRRRRSNARRRRSRWRPRSPGPALILDVLAETAATPSGPASSPAGSACRSRPSPTSAARWRTPASSGGSGRASRWAAASPSSAARTSRRSTRSRSSTRSRASCPAGSEETVQFAVLDGLEVTYLARHDGRQPVRLTSRHRPPAAGVLDGDRQGRARVAARRRARPAPRRTDHAAAAVDREVPRDGRRAARRPRRDPRARLRDRRRGDRWRASSATGR